MVKRRRTQRITGGANGRITSRHWLVAALMVALAALALHAMGRPLICTCGTVKLWTGAVQSAGNSQHLADWYTPSHLIHGFLFYALGWLFLRRNPMGERLVMAWRSRRRGSFSRTAASSSTATARRRSRLVIPATA